MEQIRSEDRGIDRVVLKTIGRLYYLHIDCYLPHWGRHFLPCVVFCTFQIDGTRIAASNTIESLMEQDFDLVINDVTYRVTSPPRERVSKVTMSWFYTTFCFCCSRWTFDWIELNCRRCAGRDGTTFGRSKFSDAIVRGPARRWTPTEERTTSNGSAGTTSIADSSVGKSKLTFVCLFILTFFFRDF